MLTWPLHHLGLTANQSFIQFLEFMQPTSCIYGRRDWQYSFRSNQHFSKGRWIDLASSIRRLAIFFPKEDELIWHHTTSGIYSVKSGYWTAKLKQEQEMSIRAEPGSSSSHRSRDFWEGLWNLKLPLKLTIFMWKFLQDRLLTNEQLNGKISSFPVECAFCGEEQSLVHLFFNCPRVTHIWIHSPLMLRSSHTRWLSSGLLAWAFIISVAPSSRATYDSSVGLHVVEYMEK